jgi:hypothetical protein
MRRNETSGAKNSLILIALLNPCDGRPDRLPAARKSRKAKKITPPVPNGDESAHRIKTTVAQARASPTLAKAQNSSPIQVLLRPERPKQNSPRQRLGCLWQRLGCLWQRLGCLWQRLRCRNCGFEDLGLGSRRPFTPETATRKETSTTASPPSAPRTFPIPVPQSKIQNLKSKMNPVGRE